MTLTIVAAQGSTLVGSESTAMTISVHLIRRLVLQMAARIMYLSLAKDFDVGKVHWVPCRSLGMTRVATALAL